MILDSTTEKITLVLAAATTTTPGDCDAAWTVSDPAASPSFNAGSNSPQTNGTTSVDLVPVPSSATARVSVQSLSAVNKDTAAMTVTFRKTDTSGPTDRNVFGPVTILPGECIQYTKENGWSVHDAAGAVKGVSSPFVVGTYILADLSANQNISAAAFTTVIYNNEVSDALGEYNPATGETTIKNTGRYFLSGYAQVEGVADGATIAVSVFRNGSEFRRVGNQNASNPSAMTAQSAQVGGSTLANLTAGDVVTFRAFAAIQVVGGTLKVLGISQLSYFSMMRVG